MMIIIREARYPLQIHTPYAITIYVTVDGVVLCMCSRGYATLLSGLTLGLDVKSTSLAAYKHAVQCGLLYCCTVVLCSADDSLPDVGSNCVHTGQHNQCWCMFSFAGTRRFTICNHLFWISGRCLGTVWWNCRGYSKIVVVTVKLSATGKPLQLGILCVAQLLYIF